MPTFDLPTFCRIIQDHKITYTYVAPPVILHLAKSPVVEEFDLRSLRIITCGAAPLSRDLIFKVNERLGTEVKQAYGLSETSPATHVQVFRTPLLFLHDLPFLFLTSTLKPFSETLALRPRLQRPTPPQPNHKIRLTHHQPRSLPRRRR